MKPEVNEFPKGSEVTLSDLDRALIERLRSEKVGGVLGLNSRQVQMQHEAADRLVSLLFVHEENRKLNRVLADAHKTLALMTNVCKEKGFFADVLAGMAAANESGKL